VSSPDGTREAASARPPLFWLVLATGFGSGYAPVASGTFGTAACAVLLWPLGPYLTGLYDAAFAIGMTIVAIAASGAVARAIGRKDPGIVVIDEFAGYATSLLFLPKTLPWLAAAFFLFRVFDVWKPWPCRRLEHLPGGAGITLDDVMAGVYVNVLLRAGALLLDARA
jgi:phosphatidylglycerophosphatase A